MDLTTLLYDVGGPIATITLNRPDRLNTIVPPMPEEFERAIGLATRDQAVKVIVVRGAGRSFCAGYDFGGGFEHWSDHMQTEGRALRRPRGDGARTGRAAGQHPLLPARGHEAHPQPGLREHGPGQHYSQAPPDQQPNPDNIIEV